LAIGHVAVAHVAENFGRNQLAAQGEVLAHFGQHVLRRPLGTRGMRQQRKAERAERRPPQVHRRRLTD